MRIVHVESLSQLSEFVQSEGIKGVVFDAFGTLVYLKQPRNPYGLALRVMSQHYSYDANLKSACMTTPEGFESFLKSLDVAQKISQMQWDKWNAVLSEEIATLTAYEESEGLIQALAGKVNTALCSNLATPYADALENVAFLNKTPKIWSCTQGKTKPNPELFDAAAQVLKLPPNQIWMVGDSWTSDMMGAEKAGFAGGVFVRRNAEKKLSSENPSTQDPVA